MLTHDSFWSSKVQMANIIIPDSEQNSSSRSISCFYKLCKNYYSLSKEFSFMT